MKKLLLITVIGLGLMTSCKKEYVEPDGYKLTKPPKANDSVYVKPIIIK